MLDLFAVSNGVAISAIFGWFFVVLWAAPLQFFPRLVGESYFQLWKNLCYFIQRPQQFPQSL